MLLLYSKIQETKHRLLLDSYLTFFPKAFQEQILNYHRWQDAQLSMLGRLLVKEGLAHFNKKVNFEKLLFTEYNKPYFQDATVQFNISHSGELVIVALTNKHDDIGIDIEKKHSLKISDFKSQMTSYEIDKIFNADLPLEEFFRYWTQKEAVLKASGSGLSIPLKSFEVKNNKTHIEEKTFYVSKIILEKGYECHISQSQKINSEEITIKRIAIEELLKNQNIKNLFHNNR